MGQSRVNPNQENTRCAKTRLSRTRVLRQMAGERVSNSVVDNSLNIRNITTPTHGVKGGEQGTLSHSYSKT